MGPPACHRCSKSHHSPHAFLLTCCNCRRTWHHRCHIPPVGDEELIHRIRATTAGNKAEDLSTWVCKRCKERDGQRSNSGIPASTTSSRGNSVATSTTATSSRFAATPEHPHDKTLDVKRTLPVPAFIPQKAPTQVIPPPTVPRAPGNASSQERGSTKILAMCPLPTIPTRVDEGNSGNDGGDDDDDDDDIYGPPVERRIIRLLPSLAEELREETPVQRDAMHPRNQTRAASMVSTCHQRKRQKINARKLGGRVMDSRQPFYFFVDNWLQEYKIPSL